MSAILASLKEFNFFSAVVRLILAMACGSVVGFGRSKKKQNAGLRTYVLTSIGAAMSVLLACYEYKMMTGQWAAAVAEIGMKFDASRYSAQVISGIGFLAAGTILSSGHQQVTGLTTAAGLFTSACMGMAAGAGMYDCVIIVLVILIVVLDVCYPIDIERTKREGSKYPAAVIVLQMGRENASHSGMLSTIAGLPCVHTIHELIA